MTSDPLLRAVETYLVEMRRVRSFGAGTRELSFREALSHLLGAMGSRLKPKVYCLGELADQGAGRPDFGLFTASQMQRGEPRSGAVPERGVVEVKPLDGSTLLAAGSEQVSDYWGRYRLVLVTNYREFLLLGDDAAGRPVRLESFSLAPSPEAFWRLTENPRASATAIGPSLGEYLMRALSMTASLREPRDVAWLLASYARDALARVEAQGELPALVTVQRALEEALGISFEGEKREHFFRSTLVQTLFYGVFSAWALWSREQPSGGSARFDWRTAAHSLHVPLVRILYEQIAAPSRLDPLGLTEVLNWAGDALNRVDRQAFFTAFEAGRAVQYFYEPFLHHFDPELRKELGVWYTPPEIVEYMVARVDTVLRTELGRPDGLADENVYVLDPCCGTGSYLVAVLARIAATLEAGGAGALLAQDLKRAATARVFGFEIMPAPFVVAHWQIGLMLAAGGAPLEDRTGERAAVYLTNALTGWTPPTGPKQHLMFPELEAERDAAEQVKRETPILVVIGNPPYNAFAGTSPVEEEGLVEPYKEELNTTWGIRKFNLDELYVRFLRVAERRIAEQTGEGVICYISSHSYVSDPSFIVARRHLLGSFDRIWIDGLNGDSRETGKLTPDGGPDPSVFSTEFNREGIRLGTAVGLFVRKPQRESSPTVRFRQFWGTAKRRELLDSLAAEDFKAQYEAVEPTADDRFRFRPTTVSGAYYSWPPVTELCAEEPISGLSEKRYGALIDIDRERLATRMRRYFDQSVDWAAVKAKGDGPVRDAGRFDAEITRARVIHGSRTQSFDSNNIKRYALLPFDTRYAYYTDFRPLWNEPRPSLYDHLQYSPFALITRRAARQPHEQVPVLFTSALPDHHLLDPNVVAIPFRVADRPQRSGGTLDLLDGSKEARVARPNLSPQARAYLAALGLPDPATDDATADALWMHALAICFAPAYLQENREGVQADWPRVPLPSSRALLEASAQRGRRLATLLDTEIAVSGVTVGALEPPLSILGVPARVGGGSWRAEEYEITAGWGSPTRTGVMPGKGKVIEREAYTADERTALAAAADRLGLTSEAVEDLLGPPRDVYLNDMAYWSAVPAAVWDYRIGGYQVIKKWLSYRESRVLGRPLRVEEARYVTEMIRRLARIVLMGPELNANYSTVSATAFDWAEPRPRRPSSSHRVRSATPIQSIDP